MSIKSVHLLCLSNYYSPRTQREGRSGRCGALYWDRHLCRLQVSCPSVLHVLRGRTSLHSESHKHHSASNLRRKALDFGASGKRTLCCWKPKLDSSVAAQEVSQDESWTPPMICPQTVCGLSYWGRCSTCEFPYEPARGQSGYHLDMVISLRGLDHIGIWNSWISYRHHSFQCNCPDQYICSWRWRTAVTIRVTPIRSSG